MVEVSVNWHTGIWLIIQLSVCRSNFSNAKRTKDKNAVQCSAVCLCEIAIEVTTRVSNLSFSRAGISIVLDCTGAGLANADMDNLMFLVSSLVNYFPKGLSYILVHELPWILKPFWIIARAWVSDEHKDLIKFSNSRTIYEYIDRENLPDFMGGTCKRDYRAAPADCTNLNQAAKLWGVEQQVVKRILAKFAEHLPADVYERAMALCNESIKNDECQEN